MGTVGKIVVIGVIKPLGYFHFYYY